MHALTRAQYESLIPRAPWENAAEPLPGAYPVHTGGAVIELRARGLDARAGHVLYLVDRGRVPGVEKGPDGWLWSAEAVDAMVVHFDALGRWTPEFAGWLALGVRPIDAIRARRAAEAKHPHVAVGAFRVIIDPPAGELGLPARIQYVPPPAEYVAEVEATAAAERKGSQ